MDWRNALAGGVPVDPSPGPPELRNDILDELGDHLSCAMQRELRRTDDEDAARAAVLERFGDPRSIARELWWGAVKERVMRDRILIGVAAVAVVVCIGATLVAYQAVQRERLERDALMQQMETLRATMAASVSPQRAAGAGEGGVASDWSYLRLRVVRDEPGRPPATGLKMTVNGRLFNDGEDSLRGEVDADGVVEFGPIRPGVVLVSAWSEAVWTQSGVKVVLYPGQKREFEIVCPVADARTGRARVRMDWSGERPDDSSVIFVTFSRDRIVTDGSEWELRAVPAAYVDARGRVLRIEEVPGLKDFRRLGQLVEVRSSDSDSIELPVGKYAIGTVYAGCMVPAEDDPGRRRLLTRVCSVDTDIPFEVKAGEETQVAISPTDAIEQAIKTAKQQLSIEAGRPGPSGASAQKKEETVVTSAALGDWSRLKIEAVLAGEESAPAAGVSIEVEGKLFNEDRNILKSKTDASGQAEFGPVRAGMMQVRAVSAEYRLSNPPRVVLYPGQEKLLKLVTPPLSEGTGQLKVRFKWPEGAAPTAGAIVMYYDGEPVEVAGWTWNRQSMKPAYLRPNGAMLDVEPRNPAGQIPARESATTSIALPAGRYALKQLMALAMDSDAGTIVPVNYGTLDLKQGFEIKIGETTEIEVGELEPVVQGLLKAEREMAEQKAGSRK